jgi:hypothetical protein
MKEYNRPFRDIYPWLSWIRHVSSLGMIRPPFRTINSMVRMRDIYQRNRILTVRYMSRNTIDRDYNDS